MKFYLVYLLALPILYFLIFGILKLNDEDYQISLMSSIFIILGFSFSLTNSIFIIASVNTAAGVALLCITLYAMGALGIYFYYNNNDKNLSDVIKYVLIIINIVLVLILIIIAFTVDSVHNYWVFTVAYLISAFGILFYSMYRLIT